MTAVPARAVLPARAVAPVPAVRAVTQAVLPVRAAVVRAAVPTRAAAVEAAETPASLPARVTHPEAEAVPAGVARGRGGGSTGSSGGSSSGSGGGSALGSGDGSVIAAYGLKFVGNPYRYGGTSLTNGTDCSGFTMSIFKKFGISLPRTSSEQSRTGKKISVSDARAGDLIFYGSGGHVSHVALCIGGGRVVHASNRKDGIKTSNIYYRTPICARRVID